MKVLNRSHKKNIRNSKLASVYYQAQDALPNWTGGFIIPSEAFDLSEIIFKHCFMSEVQ